MVLSGGGVCRKSPPLLPVIAEILYQEGLCWVLFFSPLGSNGGASALRFSSLFGCLLVHLCGSE